MGISNDATTDSTVQRGLVVENLAAAGSTVTESLIAIDNQDTDETVTNGILIEQSGAGTITNAIQIAETAGTITDGILITGTLANILNSASIDISGAGAITGATGVSSTTGTFSLGIAANGGITFDQTSDTLGSFTAGGTILMATNVLEDIGAAGTDFLAGGGLTLDDILTVNDDLTVALSGNENVEITDGATPTTDTLSIIANGATVTADANALEIDFTTGDGTDVTNSGLQIDLASGGTATTDIINGINITMDAADTSTQRGLVIGDNFDANIYFNDTAAVIQTSGAGTVTIGPSGGDTFTIDSSGSLFSFSDGTNSVTFDVDGNVGLAYAGTARPTKKIVLTPEYAGGSITADGDSNTGTLTSDNMTSTPFRNYYNWANTQGTTQDYDIWIKVLVPSDFAAMAATPTLSIDTYTSDLTNGTVLVTVYDTANSADCTNASFTPTGAINTWEAKTQTTCLDTGTYTAGGVMTINVHLTGAATTGITRVGNISFDYLAKF